MRKDVDTYVASALNLELMALDLAHQDFDQEAAVSALIEAAGGDLRVIRRAHRHCEVALAEHWPAGPALIRAFDYLSACRREVEMPLPVALGGSRAPSVSPEIVYDIVEEAGLESFPASDAPSF